MPRIDYRNSNGDRLPGTTTIIGSNLGWNTRALMYWSWDCGMKGEDYRKVSADACDIGNLVHAWVEADIHGNELPVLPANMQDSVEMAVLGYLHWKDTVKFKPIYTELSLVNEKLGYGGTLDAIMVMKLNILSDLKSSKAIYPDHKIQLSAYKDLWENADLVFQGGQWQQWNPPFSVDGLALLQVGKEDGSFHYHYWHELNAGWEIFQHLLEIHKLKKKL